MISNQINLTKQRIGTKSMPIEMATSVLFTFLVILSISLIVKDADCRTPKELRERDRPIIATAVRVLLSGVRDLDAIPLNENTIKRISDKVASYG